MTIPRHLIDKAAQAAADAPYDGERPTSVPLGHMHPTDAQGWRDTAQAAIEAVAADIWRDGWDVGRRLQGPNSNPYRASEDA